MYQVAASLLVVVLAVTSAGPVGAPVDASMNDLDVCKALQFAVAEHNKVNNEVYVSRVLRVFSVQKQVVSGIKYIFSVEMTRTSCRKGEDEQECYVHSDTDIANIHQCNLVVWSQPWLGSMQVVENTCM